MSLIERALKKMQLAEGAANVGAPQRNFSLASSTVEGREDTPRSIRALNSMTLDLEGLRRDGLLAPEAYERVTMHQYRRIKRPIVNNAFGRDGPAIPAGRLIAVTSALPGEGKTFTSFNLALNLALEQDTQVLLVDGDVAKRSLSSELGIGDRPGLLDLIENTECDMDSVVLSTSLPGLFVLPSGLIRENSTELLESSRHRRLFQELLGRVRDCLVVFDTSPLLLTAESKSVASLAGQIVLVVKAASTSRAHVREAVESIQSEKKYVALLLNQCEPSKESDYAYGSYYATKVSEQVDQ